MTVSIVESYPKSQSNKGFERTPEQRALARLQQKSKLGNAAASDEVEGLHFTVHWEPAKGAFGVLVSVNEGSLAPNALRVVSNDHFYCTSPLIE